MLSDVRFKSQNSILLLISLALIFFLAGKSFAAEEGIVKKEITSEGKNRAYYLFVPKSGSKENPAPLLMMFHGSGRNGRILIEHWQKLAEKEGIILAGPDAQNSAFWSTPADGPKFVFDLVEELKSKYSVDSHRVYQFGHSAGAGFGLIMSLLESNYFAATAISAGALRKESYRLFEQADRKIPIAIFVGTEDPLFPLEAVRGTRDAFVKRSFTAELTEIPGLNHNYYSRSQEINEKAWAFLKKYKLENEQAYKQYNFNSK